MSIFEKDGKTRPYIKTSEIKEALRKELRTKMTGEEREKFAQELHEKFQDYITPEDIQKFRIEIRKKKEEAGSAKKTKLIEKERLIKKVIE